MIEVPVATADLVDRLTILEIKLERFSSDARVNVGREYSLLLERLNTSGVHIPGALKEQLAGINRQLWDVEERIRACERSQEFDRGFIALARSVYSLNDRRSAVKREINLLCGSGLIEEKNYFSD